MTASAVSRSKRNIWAEEHFSAYQIVWVSSGFWGELYWRLGRVPVWQSGTDLSSTHTRFWEDTWIGECALKIQFFILYQICSNNN